MAEKTYVDLQFKLDNASGTITDYSQWMNSASIAAAMSVLEDTGFGVKHRTYERGAAGATVSVNGFINGTTDAVFGPLVGKSTSITKTVGFYNGVKWYTGEVWPTGVTFSGTPDSLLTFSADLTFNNSALRTSVSPA